MTFTPNDKEPIRIYFDKLCRKYDTKDVKEIHDKIIESFKTRKMLKILIVTDILITGFDAPVLWTMYLDKPLKQHRVLQAIARTNRSFSKKKFRLIVDFIGVLSPPKTTCGQKNRRIRMKKVAGPEGFEPYRPSCGLSTFGFPSGS